MANHSDHHDHHSDEKKPVAFTVPLIFASVVVLIIVMLVSLGDPKHGCCDEKEMCEKDKKECCKSGEKCEHGHGDAHATEAHTTEAHATSDSTAVEAPVTETAVATETAAAHSEGHH